MFDPAHYVFSNAPDPDDAVWRYMDLPRYLSILQSRALHFARADAMSDRWEGGRGRANLDEMQRAARLVSPIPAVISARPESAAKRQTRVHLNCWHLSPYESAAMWAIYGAQRRGIAIRSTWDRLTSSLQGERTIYGARVDYIDYDTTPVPSGNEFYAFLRKRRSFAYEQEARLLMQTGSPNDAGIHQADDLVLPVQVDLEQLVQAVLISPEAEDWYRLVVQQVTATYGYDFPVSQSALDGGPIA